MRQLQKKYVVFRHFYTGNNGLVGLDILLLVTRNKKQI